MSLPFPIYPFRREEILRRGAMQNPSPEEITRLDACLKEAAPRLAYKITERPRPLAVVPEVERGPFAGCESVIIFTARLGDAFRTLVEENQDPEQAILLSALGAERMDALVESYLDYKEKVFSPGGAALTPHYPYHWEGEREDAATTTRIVGVGFHPENMAESRCRSCFATHCANRREGAGPV